MKLLGSLLDIFGSLGLFLFGMKILSEGIQKAAGERLQKALNFMTGTRLTAVLTGFLVTAIIQSSSATTVMVVSFVNAGLLTLIQAIGVIFGANIGTTVTAWIVSLIGFQLKVSHLALPAIGIGFFLYIYKKWGQEDWGETILGFGFLFLGLDFLTRSMPKVDPTTFALIGDIEHGPLSLLAGVLAGTLITVIVHSSSASTAIFLTLAYQGYIHFELAAACILGANIGTTVDAILASFQTKANAKRAALVHTLFNVFGTVWAILLFRPFLYLVDIVTPGSPEGSGITTHLAMLHTMFNLLNTILFFPFVKPFARLVSWLIKDDPFQPAPTTYKLEYTSATLQDTPELNILRAEKEIRSMAGLVENMFQHFETVLMNPDHETVERLVRDLTQKEAYADQMREGISRFLVECARQRLNPKTERKIPLLLHIIDDLEEMTDECYGLGILLQRSVLKKMHFDKKEREQLIPYVSLVREFLHFVEQQYGKPFSQEQLSIAQSLEDRIDELRDQLRKRARKRLKSGASVKTELLFIDLVRKIEKLGDRAYSISEAMTEI